MFIFREEGLTVLGVATASHVALRTWMMNRYIAKLNKH